MQTVLRKSGCPSKDQFGRSNSLHLKHFLSHREWRPAEEANLLVVGVGVVGAPEQAEHVDEFEGDHVARRVGDLQDNAVWDRKTEY